MRLSSIDVALFDKFGVQEGEMECMMQHEVQDTQDDFHLSRFQDHDLNR
jgi:hypothetical protein